MCRLHHIDDPGEFRSTLSSPVGTVQHVLFVPVVPTTHPNARFWLLHWGDAAVVTCGHTPFHWDVVSAHIRALFPGGPLPDRCPALSFAGQFYPPGAPLPDFPSGAVTQIIIGALARIPGDDDPWNPDPLVIDSPFFRHVPSRGPALEPAIRLDGRGNRLADGASQTPLVDQGVQTDLSGNGTGLDHATVSRVHLLSRELSFHTSRLWAGLAEPDAEPVGDSPSVLRLSSQSACAAASAPNVDLLDIGGTSGSRKLALPYSVSWVLVGAQLGFRGVALGSFLALATVSDGSIIFPPPDCSDEEQSDEEDPPPVQAENMSAAAGAPVPFTIPAGPPPPEPVNAPFQPRLRYLRAARPLEDYALGLWPSTLDREPAADEDVVRRVQADLLGLQRGLRTFAAAIPLGTPFCIHNPFTARQQCDIVEYSAGPELNPFVLFQGHARSRGWAGMVLLMPQPDATAVHLIGCPQAPGNVAVGVVIDGRLLPCCLPACVACAALQALSLDGREYDLRPPEAQAETAVVQFRNGDCLAAGRRPSRQIPSQQDVQDATAETLGVGTDAAATDTCHTQVWAQFRNDDPGWAVDYFPVWPGPAFNELSIVPVGHDPALVTIMLIWGGHHRATLTPRTMTVAWLTSFVARHINSEIGGLSLPHGLAVCEYFDVPPAAFRFRNGDVVYIHDPPADPDEPLEFVEPWHLQDGLAAHHAPWAVGFQLMFPISVHLLRPEKPPLLTSIPAGESWCPEAFSFSGDFRHQFPGFWTPVQWTSARALQLMAVNEVAAKVNVVAATPEGRLCRSVDRVASRDSLAAQLRFCPATVLVGGVPSYAMEQACELRNGDVIFGEFARGDCATASCRLGWWLGTAFALSHLTMARQFLLVLAVGLMHGGQSSSLGAGALFLLPSAAAMIQRAPAAPLAAPVIPAATVNRVTLTLANPFAPWQRVEVDPSNAFEDVIADAHHTLTSWHRGFAESGLVSDGSHVLVPRPGDLIAVRPFQSDPSAGPRETPVFLTWGAAHATVCQHEEALGVHRWAPCHGVSRLTEALHMTFTFKGFPSAPPPVRLQRKPVYATVIGGFIPLQLDCLGCHLGGVAPVIGTALTAIFLRESISAVVNLMSYRLERISFCPIGRTMDIQRLAARLIPSTRFWVVIPPPSLRAAHMHTHIRLRNGDAFGFLPDSTQPGSTRFPALHYPSLDRARQVASWSLSFRFDTGGPVTLWTTSSRFGQLVYVRDNAYWDPLGPTFRSLGGETLTGSWVPVLTGDLSDLHLMSRTSISEAHVLFLLPPEQTPVGVFLAGCNTHRIPLGWQLLPAIRYVRAGGTLRDGDVLVIAPNADLVWDPFSIRPPSLDDAQPQSAPHTWHQSLTSASPGPTVLLGVLAVSVGRAPWWLGLALGAVLGSSMVPSYELLDPPIRVGLYPWRARPGEGDLLDLSDRPELDIVLLSPFTGPREAGRLYTSATITELNTLTQACEPAWGADVMPVWPTAALPALLVVPRPPDPRLVCLAVSSLALSLRAPSSLAASTPPDGVIIGVQVRHCAVWAVDFSVSVRINFILWRPGVRAIRGHAPEGAQWRALDFTFAGEFCQHYPGRWVPVPWIAQDHAHLVVVSEDPTYVNVVIEADGKCWCAPVTAATDAWQLWNDVPSISTQPRVLGLSHQELRQGTVLRNGDVVSGAPQVASPSGGVRVLLVFFLSARFLPTFPSSLVLIAGLFFGWHHEAAGARHLTIAVGLAATGQSHVGAVRTHDTPYPAGECHRLWEPSGSVSGPFFGPVDRPPEELRHAAVAWSDFTQVLPPQDPRIVDWVPVPSDPLFVVVLLQCPPATRAAILPATCHAADLTRACRRSVPDLACVLASPEIWCGTATSFTPTLFLWSGDVLTLACAGWAPRLRSPSGRYWDTFYQARKFAFWGSPFQIRMPGLLFAWSAGDPVPLTVHTVQNEVWDPVHCTFRPSLARYSVDRWIPAARCDLLGLHLVPESLNPHCAHVLPTQPPLRLLEVSRYSTQGLIRDGDSGSFGSSAPSPRLLLCLVGLLLARNALSLWPSGGALLLAGASFGAFPFSDTLVFPGVAPVALPVTVQNLRVGSHMWPQIAASRGCFTADGGPRRRGALPFWLAAPEPAARSGAQTAPVPPAWSASLLECYGRAWGAPADDRDSDAVHEATPAAHCLDLQDAGYHYAGLAAHYLFKPLLTDLPSSLAPLLHQGWCRFPRWPGGVPDEVFIATDGSGLCRGGWALAVWVSWKGNWYRLGWDAGSLASTPWLPSFPATHLDIRSYLGELSALVSAAAWFTVWWDNMQLLTGHAPARVTLAVDNSAALQVAGGHASATTPHARVCRALWQSIQSRCSTHFRHVPGHTGSLVNEIADALAGYGTVHDRCASVGWCRLPTTFGDSLLECAPLMWLLPQARLEEGRLCWRSLGWVDCPHTSMQVPPPIQPHVRQDDKQVKPLRTTVTLVQANIQTMKDVDVSFFNRDGHGQRRIYLAKQLRTLGVHIAFLQECRSRPGRWSSHGFLSFRSGAEKGLFGVEIWIRPDLLHPALSLDDFRIRFASPRILLVQCQRAELPVTLVAAHAPHAERPDADIRRFWHDLRTQLLPACNRGTVLLGIDANADFIGHDEEETLVGDLLNLRPARLGDDLLLACAHDTALAAPGTWSEVCTGPTWTWQHTGGKTQRLDHLLITHGTRVSEYRQFPEFDILNGEARDHMPIVTTVDVSGKSAGKMHPRCPYSADSGASVAEAVWDALHQSPPGSSAERVQQLCDAHDHAVRRLPARPPLQKRQPYLSEVAAGLLETLRDARAEVRRLQTLYHRQLCLVAFRAWCRRRVESPALPWELHQVRMMLAHFAHVCFRLRAQAHAQARLDKQAYFESMLLGAVDHWHATGRPLEAVAKLSWASKGAKQKRDVRAASGFDIDEQLQLQFQQQEDGRPVSDAQLSAAFSLWAAAPRGVCLSALPTLLDVEHMCRLQRRGKAPGPDHIRNEVWRTHPDRAGRWLWPMWVHLAWGEAEPLHFKASTVGALHKKGPAHIPANFRSIAMLNGVAKLWHSQLRATLGQEVIAHYFPTQLGGRRGVDTGLALTVFRSAVDLASVHGRSWAALFVDIQAAYYEADRTLLFHGRDLEPALAGLQLPRHVHGLIQDGVLAGLGVPADQVALLRDCVECSYWRLVGQHQAIMAGRGSRPGDGLADVLFGALFAVILQCLHFALKAEDIVHAASSDALGRPDASLQIAWADDLCLLVDFIRATWAVSKLRRLCTIVLQVFEAFRFRVNLGAGKTEALVHLQGAGANVARKDLLTPEPLLALSDGRGIRVVPEYKYLGVVQRCRDTGRRDVEAAAARGNSIWTQASGLVHSEKLPWMLKSVWLQGRTLPAAYSSLATTLARSERAWGPLNGFYDKCLRQIVGSWDAGHHVASVQLRACTGVLDVECATVIARVRLLCRIASGRSPEVFELFQASWDRGGEWSSLLADAVRRVWPACGLPALQTGEPTLLCVRRRTKEILSACRRISRSGTMLLALHRAWRSHGGPPPKRVIGLASPHICPECGVTLPSAHALAAHAHRLHGRVALCTQYTLGTICLWCLVEFHNAARLRYHLLHSPDCEHGLRCCVGPVYEYGTGTKRRGKQGHARAPVFRVAGPCNATAAQRRAAEEGRCWTEEELSAELRTVAPGPSFSEGTRSSPVVPFRRVGGSSTLAPGDVVSTVPCPVVLHSPHDPVALSTGALDFGSPTSSVRPPLADTAVAFARYQTHPADRFCIVYCFDEAPGASSLCVPSCRWCAVPPAIWCLPQSWARCWKLFLALDSQHPWSAETWRLTAFLRQEERPSPGATLGCLTCFDQIAAQRVLFLRRMLTCLHLLRQIKVGAALWCAVPLPSAFWELLRRVVPLAVGTSAVAVLGFGTVISLPAVAPRALTSLASGWLSLASPRRLAMPHQLPL
ncbi:unnamed protein product [Symbiodinium sp. CCMP2592]|nr:unnamed protein product [Symbiodinium sp. CCMP2592]